MFTCWKNAIAIVWQSNFKEIIEHNINNNSLIKRLSNFYVVFSNSDRRRYVVEENLHQSKMKKSFLLLNITTLVKFILFSSTCSVQWTCHIFVFFYSWFSVINFLYSKKHIKLLLEKNGNNWSFWLLTLLVLSKHKYLIYKNK